MPAIKIQHIVSFSSEDKVYKAENLLKSDTYRKWKCLTPGEKQASVVLQLEMAIKIQSIDIGNEGSAFIEVLVGRSSETKDDYQVLLVASSFMTPIESRQNTNLNKVRMFGPECLSQAAAKEKWDRVKVVCTQPFNKSIQYGLSFITLNSQPDASEVKSPKTPTKQTTILGQFKIKDDDEDKVQVGSFFTKHLEKKISDPLAGPAAIRQASNSVETSPSTSKEKLKNQTLFANKVKAESKDEYKTNKHHLPQPFGANKRKMTDDKTEVPAKKAKDTPTPFYQLMKDVVFVISGFQNPLRGEIRDKALAMGAKYKPDWNDSCTHLVCAFMNTPKYQQVKSKNGKIVKKDWIIDCHRKRALLSWQRYKFENPKDDSTSESEPDVPVRKLQSPKLKKPDSPETTTKTNPLTVKQRPSEGNVTKESSKPERVASDDEIFEADTDVDSNTSECDTEDELMEVKMQATKKKDEIASGTKQNTSKLPLPKLSSVFKGMHFFLYGNLDVSQRHLLQRCILGCFGEIEDYMSDSINYIVTNDKWNQDFTDALSDNKDIKFVKPQWVHKCIENEKLLSYKDYEITNSS